MICFNGELTEEGISCLQNFTSFIHTIAFNLRPNKEVLTEKDFNDIYAGRTMEKVYKKNSKVMANINYTLCVAAEKQIPQTIHTTEQETLNFNGITPIVFGYCPRCNSSLEVIDLREKVWKKQYCPWCGQRIELEPNPELEEMMRDDDEGAVYE